jgi:Flp pilus assembly protein TadG
MMKLRTGSEAGRCRRWLRRSNAEGGGRAVACASAAPLMALALAVAADRAQVSRFTTQVQLAADAASLAAAGAVARHPDSAGDGVAAQVAAVVFARKAPRGAAGKPTVAATSNASAATATVGYDGVAPSNFGSALGYGAFRVSASATPLALLADSRRPATP